jgi:hypothetical protein
MTIKNNLYQPISVLLENGKRVCVQGKSSLEVSSVSDHMKSLEKSGSIKIN